MPDRLMKALRVAALALLSGTISAPSGQAAQDAPVQEARRAIDQLERAVDQLAAARSARDRVEALTRTVRAFETGLSLLRDGQRRLVRRQTQLSRRLEAKNAEIATLIGTLQSMARTPPPVHLLHPSGPVGAARAGMILADVAPALHARTQALRRDLAELAELRRAQEAARSALMRANQGIAQARAALTLAMADRTTLPRRFTEDPVRTAILLESARSLGEFAAGLERLSTLGGAGQDTEARALKGTLALPVRGTILHRAGAADAAGVRRDGIVLATRPGALVSTPVGATIRYRGPLLDLGNLIILEPQAEVLIILSGMHVVFGDAGQVIAAGTPVGLMGNGRAAGADSTSRERVASGRSQTLYVEVREKGAPVDPLNWFRIAEDG